MPAHDVTALLIEWRGGNDEAVQQLLPLVHNELRRLARRHMAGERPDHVLQATALVNGGGALQRVAFDQNLPVTADTPNDLIAIDDALRALSAQYERKAQVVELRFFGGLSVEETAEVLQISQETVMRDWKFAKNWLMRELSRNNRSRVVADSCADRLAPLMSVGARPPSRSEADGE